MKVVFFITLTMLTGSFLGCIQNPKLDEIKLDLPMVYQAREPGFSIVSSFGFSQDIMSGVDLLTMDSKNNVVDSTIQKTTELSLVPLDNSTGIKILEPNILLFKTTEEETKNTYNDDITQIFWGSNGTNGKLFVSYGKEFKIEEIKQKTKLLEVFSLDYLLEVDGIIIGGFSNIKIISNKIFMKNNVINKIVFTNGYSRNIPYVQKNGKSSGSLISFSKRGFGGRLKIDDFKIDSAPIN